MASWDFPAVAAPRTADYAAPLVNFDAIANLPKDYYAGKEMARQDEKATAFRNGIPRVGNDPNGEPDYNKITDTAARIGGIDYALPLLNLQTQRQSGQAVGNAIGGGQPTGQPQPVQPPNPASAPPSGQSVSALSLTGSDNSGQDTIRSLATEFAGGQDAMPAIGSAARVLRIHPDAPLTPEQTARVKDFLGNAVRGGPATAADPTQPADQPAAMTPAQRVAQGADAARPQGVASSQGVSDETTSPFGSGADARKLLVDADKLDALVANNPQMNKQTAEAAARASAAKRAQATKIMDYIGGEEASTPPQKDYQSDKLPGETMADYQARAAGGVELAKADSTAYSKKYEGIQKASQEASIEQPKIQLMKTFANDPNFYSGPLEPTNRGFKQFAATIGVDPNRALPQEGFNKVASDMLTSQIRALGASGAGPVRIAEVKNMQKSIANLGITPVTNRLLVEITDRTYKDVQAIADLTRKYELDPKNLPGKKNVGLDQRIHDYYESHPLFTKEEMADPRLIAPPEFKDSRMAFNAKLPKGQPVKIDGKLKWVQ